MHKTDLGKLGSLVKIKLKNPLTNILPNSVFIEAQLYFQLESIHVSSTVNSKIAIFRIRGISNTFPGLVSDFQTFNTNIANTKLKKMNENMNKIISLICIAQTKESCDLFTPDILINKVSGQLNPLYTLRNLANKCTN